MAADQPRTLPVIGDVPDGWDVLPFGSVLVDGTRSGIYKSKEHHGRGVKIVNMGELFSHPRLFAIPMKRVEVTESELAKSQLSVGDLLFARRSLVAEGAGKCCIVLGLDEPTVAESSIIRTRPDARIADSLFLYYLFKSPFGAYSLGSILRHVAVAGITGSDLVTLPIPLPPLGEQRAIAHILGTLDDKIELNRQMNATLEAMARALFKSWFVDFDPVRAKADGRETGLPGEIAVLFPDSFEDSEVSDIPAGWRVMPIGDLAQVVGGSTPSTKDALYWDGGIYHWATPKDLSGLTVPVLVDTERRITDAGLAQIGSGLLPAGTVLMSSRAPIGYLAMSEIPVAINQGFIAMKPKEGVSNLFLLLWADASQEAIISRANGSTFLEISKANFRPIPVVSSPPSIMLAFDSLVRPIYERIVTNVREARILAALQSALLPKLISGEVRVASVEKLLGRQS